MSRIGVVGAGYVGLTTGACLAHLGHDVACVETNPTRLAALRAGTSPILEPGLEDLLREGLGAGRLRFTDRAAEVLGDREFVFLCLPTPQDADGRADLRFLHAAVEQIRGVLPAGAVVITKSTVPVGSAESVGEWLGRGDVHVVSNPEFLREGSAVRDFLHPDRVVIGTRDAAVGDRVAMLFREAAGRVIVCDPVSAETIKYAANSYLAARLSFANALAAVCEAVGADVSVVMDGVGADARIGPQFLQPGPGWGGSCLPKDTAALIATARDSGYDFALLRAVIEMNQEQHRRIVDKVRRAAGETLADARIGVLGLAFKAHTDDLRDSPALTIVGMLRTAGARIRAFDPAVRPSHPGATAGHAPAPGSPLADLTLCDSALGACDGADVVFVATEWPEFAALDPAAVARVVARRSVVDARNVLDPARWRATGFTYVGVGR
jgi:UDPglucose 6-dehydrogenase